MSKLPTADEVLHGAHCGHAGAGSAVLQATTPSQDLLRGVWRENPVFRQVLGLCPALAVTNTVENSVAMGVATFAVLTGSSLLVSTFKRLIPHEVRLTTYVLIIATFVTIVDLVMAATVPHVHKALGAFVYLIVVNCMILSRQEAFASRRPVGRSLLDAMGTGAGFMIALLMMGGLRELLGSGSLLGQRLLGPSFEPWVVMSLPPGGFFSIAFLLLAFATFRSWRQGRGPTIRQVHDYRSRVAL